MKIFIELPEAEVGGPCFAFFDTVTDRFDEWLGHQCWEDFDALSDDLRQDLLARDALTESAVRVETRYRLLTPVRFGGLANE